ncbi:hypothetical protein HAD_17481 [Hyphomonas adhaerens MHS-3]|uniref:Uncharacterized protein n=1 Tax=Hyphomonas adhaerens MHS-3 TaxID=1280949 RepID=A0A069E089_9PROT|nr:hypothetical protein HAD_17481 [Hyphomonas adhaerens MHS-3]
MALDQALTMVSARTLIRSADCGFSERALETAVVFCALSVGIQSDSAIMFPIAPCGLFHQWRTAHRSLQLLVQLRIFCKTGAGDFGSRVR